MLARLAHLVHRRRGLVVAVWVALTAFGAFATMRVADRWFESFSIPGYSAYETNQKTVKTFGTGERAPLVAVFQSGGDVTKEDLQPAIAKAAAVNPGSRTSSYFDSRNDMYVSKDRRTTFAEIYPPGQNTFSSEPRITQVRKALAANAPPGVTTHLTGLLPLYDVSSEGSEGPSILTEAMIGGVGALVILLFVFGTLPAVGIPLAIAISSILNTFTLVWALTYVTDVSIIVQFLIALVGLGVAVDYALLMIFRFRDELREGNDVESSLVETMTHAGHSVIISGTTVAVGLLAMVLLPLPLLRSMGLGGMLIPVVSVLATLTLLPAMLAVLGPRINSVRVMPGRFIDRGHPEAGRWGRWARFVLRHPLAVAAVGLVIVAGLAGIATQLNPTEAELGKFPGTGSAIAARDELAAAGISPGVMKPLNVLVENGGDAEQVAAKLATVPGIVGASAPPEWQKGPDSLVEAFATVDGSAAGIQVTIDRANASLEGTTGTLTGLAAVDRDFLHALFGSFPYVLGLVLLLTVVLLTRAFRSLVLALKAVVLNLLSLAATFGIIVFVFQMGHGSGLWDIPATGSITAWIPVMIFAFLFGLSMDYEVFMLTRMREAYDETASTDKAIELGLARTGKLVTSAALVLMFAFLALSTSPGYEIKPLAIGLAAGIIFDATVIRALLVPALMKLMGGANWWMPNWLGIVLRIPKPKPSEIAPVPVPVPVPAP